MNLIMECLCYLWALIPEYAMSNVIILICLTFAQLANWLFWLWRSIITFCCGLCVACLGLYQAWIKEQELNCSFMDVFPRLSCNNCNWLLSFIQSILIIGICIWQFVAWYKQDQNRDSSTIPSKGLTFVLYSLMMLGGLGYLVIGRASSSCRDFYIIGGSMLVIGAIAISILQDQNNQLPAPSRLTLGEKVKQMKDAINGKNLNVAKEAISSIFVRDANDVDVRLVLNGLDSNSLPIYPYGLKVEIIDEKVCISYEDWERDVLCRSFNNMLAEDAVKQIDTAVKQGNIKQIDADNMKYLLSNLNRGEESYCGFVIHLDEDKKIRVKISNSIQIIVNQIKDKILVQAHEAVMRYNRPEILLFKERYELCEALMKAVKEGSCRYIVDDAQQFLIQYDADSGLISVRS